MLALLVPICVLLASCGGKDDSVKPPATGSVMGRIVDRETGEGVADAAVVLVDPTTIAPRSALTRPDAEGRYRIDAVPPGRYSLFLQHQTMVVYERTSGSVEVEAGGTTTQDFMLQDGELARAWSIAGRVVDAMSGEPVAGAYVGESTDWGGESLAAIFARSFYETAVTDSDGSFTLNPLLWISDQGEVSGFFPISASHAGYRSATLGGSGTTINGGDGWPTMGPALPLPADGDSVLHVTIRLHPLAGTGAVRGRVVFLGKAAAGVRVGLSWIQSSEPDTFRTKHAMVPVPEKTAVTDAEGRFVISGLAPGWYACVPGYAPDDGVLPGRWLNMEDSRPLEVAEGDTIAAGDFQVGRALRPLAPVVGSAITDTIPQFTWTAFPAGPGYQVVGYQIWYASGIFEEERFASADTTWTLPEGHAFAHGTHIRWMVDALIRLDAHPDSVFEAGTFEGAGTFSVR